ncbi:hypothetical protein, partial [Neisseria sp.]|uniref:hypothetical protein n=1 Tax=Neisseria sp. TaxID=192066 RepID=UPI00289BB3C7
ILLYGHLFAFVALRLSIQEIKQKLQINNDVELLNQQPWLTTEITGILNIYFSLIAWFVLM